MPRAEAACVEDAASNSETDSTKPNTKVSATTKKEEKKHSKKSLRPHRKEKKSKSEDGLLDVELSDGDVAIAKHVRVIPELKKGSRKSTHSAPVNAGHSPKKLSRPPAPRGVTFDPASSNHHDKNDKRYFGRTAEHTTIASSSRPRTQPVPEHVRPQAMRPISYQGPLPIRSLPQTVHYSPPFVGPYPIAPGYAASMPAYEEPYYGSPQPPISHLASRFGRTGHSTLNTNPLPQASWQDNDRYDEEEDECDSEEDRRIAEAKAKRDKAKKEERKRSAHEEREREDARLDLEEAAAYLRQKRILDRADREREDRERMPPPPPAGVGRKGSYRNSREAPGLPEVHYPSFEDYREDNHRRSRDGRGSFGSDVRPQFPHGDTEPPMRTRKPSVGRAPTSSSAASYGRDPLRPRDPRANVLEVPRRGQRPNSFYGSMSAQGTSASSNYEEDYDNALRYQDEIAAEGAPLTEELLKKQQRRIKGGSRSTQSTTSRDESDVRQSVTTRTTRSGSGDGTEQTTFTIKGNGTVNIDGAEISTRATDGPIEITLQRGGDQKTIRNGSEASQSAYAPSGSTAVSDDRPKPNRRDSMRSHGRKPPVDDVRFRGDLRDHPLRDRLAPLRSNSQRSHRPVDYERVDRGGYF